MTPFVAWSKTIVPGSRLLNHSRRRAKSAARKGFRPWLDLMEERTLLSAIVVNNATDTPVAGETDLRQAIVQANETGGAETITFDKTVFDMPQTITLGGTQLELSTANESVTITGPAGGLTVSGGGASRVFQVDSGVTASISGLTISGGNTTGSGGGLENFGTTTLTNCTVSGSSAYNGGGLSNDGTLTVTNCTVSGNTATATPSNFSKTGGGGLYNGGTLTMTDCTVSGNTASGVFTGGGVVNGTRYNTAPTLTMINCTISANTGWEGGLMALGAPVTLTNTIVVGNPGGDVYGYPLSGTNNLIGTVYYETGLVNGVNGNLLYVTNPLLAPLGNYGGPTQTVALLPGSPAINAGTSTGAPTTDQRGLGRVGAVDIGAFESQGFTLTPLGGSTPQTASIGTAFANPLAVSVTANNPVEPVNGGVVTFVANPASNGASAALFATSAVIANGQAAVTAAPNNMDGSSQVTASASVGLPATFNLTNTGPVFAHLIVNTTSPSLFLGAGLLSLPEAILFANFDRSGNSSITFSSSVFATPQTITLAGNQLELSNTVETETITGPTAGVTISGNDASRVFLVDASVTASILVLTISGGNAGAFGNNGGGLANFGALTMTDCTVSGNSAVYRAGGLYNGGTLTMTDCTVSGNSADFGAGVYNGTLYNLAPMAMLTDCTVSGNSGYVGGLDTQGAPVTLTNTIVAENSGADIYAILALSPLSGTNNLIGTGAAGGLTNGVNGNLVGVTDPLLAPLGNYGGPTQTVALLPGSPAINAGTNGPGIPTTDQRGLGRVGAVDIGAFESQGFTLTVLPGSSPQTSHIGTAFANPLAVSVTANNPVEPVNGGVVTFVAHAAANGATAFFLSASSAAIAGGQAALTAAPNNMDGSYQVLAVTAASGSSPATFNLTNTGPVFTHLIVNTTSASLFPGAGLLSLPEAIPFADFDRSGNSHITFDNQVFKTSQTITLTGTQLELSNTSETETITGPNKRVTVNGGGLSRVFQIDALVSASISGLTITGGTTTANGGGLANFGTTTLNNCTISDSSATSYGGGLYNGRTLMMTNCTVSGNSAALGGGVGDGNNGLYFNHGATATLANCTVSGNSAGAGGGGVDSAGTVTLTKCTVSGNSAGRGGGVYNLRMCTLTDCTIRGNSARNSGGGVTNGNGLNGNVNDLRTVTVIASNCSISGNSAFDGGGLYNFIGTATLTNCTVSGNSATGSGGGLGNNNGTITSTNCTVSDNSAGYAGGGLSNVFGGTATLTNCIVSGNSATKGGGVYNGFYFKPEGRTILRMTNCTVSGNSATGNDGGGGVNNYGSTATLINCTVSGNSATGNGGGLCNSNTGGYFGGPATATLTNCTVSGNSTTGNGGGVSTGGFGYYGYQSSGTTTLTNCSVSGNSATGNGGGISNASLGNTAVTGTNVKDNSAVAGGGLFNQGALDVASSNLNNNQARGGAGGNGIGGGICSSGGSVALSSSALTANTATGGAGASGQAGGNGIGGGLALENDATATITNTSFLGNLAQGGAGGAGANGGDGIGGGIAVAIGGASDTSSVSLSNSLLSLNVAQGGKGGAGANGGNGEGGGAFVGAAGSAALDQTDILLNLALAGLAGAGGSDGDGIGGGLYVTAGGVVTLKKTTVALNFASTSNNNTYGIVSYV